MMKRTPFLVCVIAAMVLSSHSRADAIGLDDLWDIIEPLSGPGPFVGGPVIAATIMCWEGRTVRIDRAMESPDKNDPCWYIDFRDLSVKADGTYQDVSAKLVETGFSIEPQKFMEIGVGFGVAYFATTVDKKEFTVTNATVTPIRLILKPLRGLPKWRNTTKAGWLQVHARVTRRFGKLNGSDFGVAANTFDTGSEWHWGAGLVFDLLQAARGR